MLVSILIPCYNAERWISQCIESALAQTAIEKEVIVVDDGSTDGSLEIIQSFGDRIRWETGPNQGGNKTRNRLLDLCQGTWIQYLDADDYLLPDKVERQLQFAIANPDADVIYSRVVQETHLPEGVQQGVSLRQEPFDPWCQLVLWELPQTGALLWRRSALVKAGGWKPDQPCCQEHELYLRALSRGVSFAYCPDVGAVYRQWQTGSVCTRDPRETLRRRVDIINDAEIFLRKNEILTTERHWSINHARLEVARQAWQYDRAFAKAINLAILRSMPTFAPNGPGCRTSLSSRYDWSYKLFGFSGAELIAGFLRRRVQK